MFMGFSRKNFCTNSTGFNLRGGRGLGRYLRPCQFPFPYRPVFHGSTGNRNIPATWSPPSSTIDQTKNTPAPFGYIYFHSSSIFVLWLFSFVFVLFNWYCFYSRYFLSNRFCNSNSIILITYKNFCKLNIFSPLLWCDDGLAIHKGNDTIVSVGKWSHHRLLTARDCYFSIAGFFLWDLSGGQTPPLRLTNRSVWHQRWLRCFWWNP